jgi:hypothetical protein
MTRAHLSNYGQVADAWLRSHVPGTSNRSRGQMIVLFAFALTFLMGMAGVAIDGGSWLVTKRNYQRVADVCARMGASQRGTDSSPFATTTARATTCTTDNGIASGVSVNIPPSEGPNAGNNTFVEVIVNRPVDTLFVKIVGINSVQIRARAVAGSFQSQIYALMGIQPNTESLDCDGCSSATINGSACARGTFDGSNNMTITGFAVANGGFSTNPSASGYLSGPGSDPCLDPGYGLPNPLPAPQVLTSLTGGQPFRIENTDCPGPGVTKRVTHGPGGDFVSSNQEVQVRCGGGQSTSDSTSVVEIEPPRTVVSTPNNNPATVRLLSSSATIPGAAVFERVTADGGRLEAAPGYYNRLEFGGNGLLTTTSTPMGGGLYVINSHLILGGNNAAVCTGTTWSNPCPNLAAGAPGISMIVGHCIGDFTTCGNGGGGNGAYNFTCCWTTNTSDPLKANNIVLYHLRDCSQNSSRFYYALDTASNLFPSTWNDCSTDISLTFTGNNANRTVSGGIYSPYDPNLDAVEARLETTNGPLREPAGQDNYVPKTCVTGVNTSACIDIGGSGGINITGQVIAPTVEMNGNGIIVTFNPNNATQIIRPYLAE